MLEEDFIRAEFHCGWRAIEKPDGYTFVNSKGQVMPHRFWKVSDFDEETGVAQVEFMKGGKGCVTFDARILPLPFDGELVDKLTKDKSVYKVHLPHKRIAYRIYDSKTQKLEDRFAQWDIVKAYKEGGRLVCVGKGAYRFVDGNGKFDVFVYKQWLDTVIGTIITDDGFSWVPIKDGKPYPLNMLFLCYEDEIGKYFTGYMGKVVLTKDGQFSRSDFKEAYPQMISRISTPRQTNEDVLLHSANITVHKKKPSQKYYKVTLDIEGKEYSLEELGEDIKVSGAYKNSTTKKVYLYGAHTGEEVAWWTLDQDGNVDKLSDVCEYGYDKDGSIVSKGKTVIFKARDIENKNAKTL